MAHPKNPTYNKPSKEDIALCLSKELDLNISLETHPELLASIELSFECYFNVSEDKLGTFPLDTLINAISALEEAKPYYLGLLETRWMLDHITKPIGSDYKLPSINVKKIKKRKAKIDSLMQDLEEQRKEILKMVENLHPIYKISFGEPKNWLSWSLWGTIEREFPQRGILKYQIAHAVYQLLRLHGIEKESQNPEDMISRRVRRVNKRIEPHIKPS